jgi:pSer/pThr/pTyr-binding forkhead associated (FHA) protein/RNA polymerase subunit RPABC4/transcription elongation factor Spt4
MRMSVGFVCPQCDALTELGVSRCPACGAPLGWNGVAVAGNNHAGSLAAGLARPGGGVGPVSTNANASEPSPQAQRAPKAKGSDGAGSPGAPAARREASMATKSCPSCGNPVPAEDRFCGKCGNRFGAEPAGSPGKTMYFSGSQAPGRAKLIVVKGDAGDGVSYQLNGTDHLLGRSDGPILFPDDPLISPRHANFLYREGKLYVRDEGSQNGVFIRIRNPVVLDSGGAFLVGEQLLQVEASAPDFGPQPDAEGTYYYASPKRASKMRLIQRLRGGDIGIIFRARGDTISIGRENNDVNFPDDPFISGHHAQVSIGGDGRFTLTDLGSKNGTFVRIGEEASLQNGDYVFIGQQLLRVELA